MKKKRLTIILSSIAVVALIGGTYAAFTASTSTKHKVKATELGIELVQKSVDDKKEVKPVEGFGDEETMSGLSYAGLPGDTVKEDVYVSNTKTETCFIRVTINRSWMKEEEDGSFSKTFDKADPKEIRITPEDGWIIMEDPDDEEVLYCYYKKAVPQGESTTKVMKEFSILKDMNTNSNAYAGLAANIVFEADAVQSFAAADAMLAEWGVVAEIENDHIKGTPVFQ